MASNNLISAEAGIGKALGQGTATVISPEDLIAGYSQADLGDKWWQYAHSIPYAEHFGAKDDNSDPDGKRGSLEKALSNQPVEDVLFIGGAFGSFETPQNVSQINRTIILPPGTTTVFFPLINGENNNVTGDPEGLGYTEADKRAGLGYINPFSDTNPVGVSGLFAKVDGTEVTDPDGYRQESEPGGFYYTPVAGGLYGGFFREGQDQNTIYLEVPDPDPSDAIVYPYPSVADQGGWGSAELFAVADGYWLGVELDSGEHTLNFGGKILVFGETVFGLNVTYNILNPIYGGNGKDNLRGTEGNDYIDGGNGKDNLLGNKGDDLLVGGAGADVIDGGKGNDELWGDNGKDTFIFKRGYGQDTIFDFTSGERIEIPGLPVPPIGVSDVDYLPTVEGVQPAAQINFGGGDILTLVGVSSSDLNIQRGLITL